MIAAITASDGDGAMLEVALPYLAYADIVASLRDDLALRANNDAQVLAALPLETSFELCTIAVTDLVRRYVSRQRASGAAAPPTDDTLPKHAMPAKAIDAVWEIAGIYAVMPLMLLEVANARRSGATRAPLSTLDALRAAQRLCSVAEDWQALSDVRQRIAWHRDDVTRVEPGFLVHVGPSNPTYECLALVARRRQGLLSAGFQRQSVEPLRHILVPFILPVADFVAQTRCRDTASVEFAEHILTDLVSSSLPSDGILLSLFERSDSAGATGRALFSAYLLCYALAYSVGGFRRGKNTYFPRWPRGEIAELIAASARTTTRNAEAALELVSWDPGEPTGNVGLDLGTIPYLRLPNSMIGTLVLPGVRLSPFAETRRTLAATNRLSADVGKSYESYVRRLLTDGMFEVRPGCVIIRADRRAITDIDILAYKNGVLIVCQAKHLVEPDSHHARWKARQEVRRGIRQCIQARNYFREDPERVFALFPEARADAPIEVFCLVVTPAMSFCGELAWPVAVVDDAYLQHIIHIGATRTFSAGTGDLVAAEPLYEGAHPSGQEFRSLMTSPEFFRYYRGDKTALFSTIRAVHHVRFIRLDAVDSQS
jgi:hypothetical protein